MASVPNKHHTFTSLCVDWCQMCQFQHDLQSCKFSNVVAASDPLGAGVMLPWRATEVSSNSTPVTISSIIDALAGRNGACVPAIDAVDASVSRM